MLTNETGLQHKMDMLYRQYIHTPNIAMSIFMHIIHPVFPFYLQVEMHLLHTLPEAHLVTFLSGPTCICSVE